jgi:hypothetical protein
MLWSIQKFLVESQKIEENSALADQVKGTEKARDVKSSKGAIDTEHPFAGRLVGGESIEPDADELLREFEMFQGQSDITEEDSDKKSFTVVYYSPKTDRNVTKTIRADSESAIWDQLKSRGVDVVSVAGKGMSEGAMPASVIKSKENIRLASDAENKKRFAGKTKNELAQLARRHGYGGKNPYAKFHDGVTESTQGLAEGFPYDVDHMPGPVIRNADMTTDNVKTKDKAEWDRAVNSINARVFDDMSEFRSDSRGEQVTGNSAVWAKWDNATQTGWFNAKGRPLKPRPVKEQNVAEQEGASPVVSSITRRIINQRHDLLKYGPEAVMAAVDEVADRVGDVEEIGSSDISAWVNQVEIMLRTQGGQGVAEGTGVTDFNPGSQGGTRKELLAKYHKTQDPKDAESARRAGASQKELQGVEKEVDESYTGKGNNRPGWMLRADLELAKKIKQKKELGKKRQKAYGDPSAGISIKDQGVAENELAQLARRHGHGVKNPYAKFHDGVTESAQGVAEGYWEIALKKAEADREARKGKPFEKNPASHDDQGIYKGDRDLAGNPVPKRKLKGVAEASLDPSGLQAAAGMVQNFIVTAEVDGKVKKFRVRGMTGARSAQERFLKHHSMARILDVKPEQDVAEGSFKTYEPRHVKWVVNHGDGHVSEFDPNEDAAAQAKYAAVKGNRGASIYAVDQRGQSIPRGSLKALRRRAAVAEAKSLNKRVRVVKTGEIGTIRQIKHGLFKGAPKTYFVDLDNGKQADNLPASALRLVKDQGVAEGEVKTQKYEMMMRNGQVKKFVAKDDADAKRIAKGHGAKSVIRMKGNVPGDKIAEQGVAEASFTAAASMHAATRKRDPQRENPKHSIRTGDSVTTPDGKSGIATFVDGETVHVKGTNTYYPDRATQYKGSELKKGVAENIWDDDEEDETPSELHSGGYVRDRQEGERGEVFIMRGNPEERRVRIEDKNGSGWNISPSRLIPVSDDDPAIARYFGGAEETAETADTKGSSNKYTARETRDGIWRVFQTGQSVSVAGPFGSSQEASAWIAKQGKTK